MTASSFKLVQKSFWPHMLESLDRQRGYFKVRKVTREEAKLLMDSKGVSE